MSGMYRQLLVCIMLILLLAGCGQSFESMAQKRDDFARNGDGRIVIAVFDDIPGNGYLDGIRLAVDQLNTSDEGLLGRYVELLVQPGGDDFDALRGDVRDIAANPQVTAVLGHRKSSVAVPASVIYEAAQIMFLPPFATAEQLTLHGFQFVLRMLPDSRAMAAQSASVAALFGYQRMAVLHSREDYNREQAFLFEDEARRREGIETVFRSSFFDEDTNFRAQLGQLNGVDFDALYLSAGTESGALILQQMRELGLEQPVIGSDDLNGGELKELSGKAGDRTIVPTIYSSDTDSISNQDFLEDFEQTFKSPPNQNAAQGYDSINILANIIKRAGTTEPLVVATTAHYAPPMAGITGMHAYDPNGDIYGKSFRFKILRFGRWSTLPGVTAPYLLSSFREALQQESGSTPDNSADEVFDIPAETVTDNGQFIQAESASSALSDQEVSSGLDTQSEDSSEDVHAPVGEDGLTTLSAVDAPDSETQLMDQSPVDTTAPVSKRLSRVQRLHDWLSLVHEFLDFQQLGMVVMQTSKGDDAVSLAASVAEQRGFEIEPCLLPELSEQTTRESDEGQNLFERETIACYSKLARTVDALLVVPDDGLSELALRQLNRSLHAYGVPTFTLDEPLEFDYGLSLAVTASEIDLDDPNVSIRFDGVLKDMEVHDLNRKLANLPIISMDLAALEQIRPELHELTVISNVLEVPPTPVQESGAEPAPNP